MISTAVRTAAQEEGLSRVWAWSVALIPLIYLPGLPNGAEGPQAMAAAIATTFVASTLIMRTPRARLHAPAIAFAWPAGLLLLLATASLAWSDAPLDGGKRILGAALCAAAYVVTSHLLRTPAAVMWTFRGLAVSGTLIASLGLLQRAGLDLLPQVAAPAAHFMNRTLAVEVSVVLLPLGLAFRAADGRWAAVARILTLVLPTLFVLTSGARMGLFAWGAQVLIAAILLSTRGSRSRLSAFSTLTVLLIGLGLLVHVVTAPTRNGAVPLPVSSSAGASAAGRSGPQITDSLDIRLELWRSAGRMFESSPWVGVGLGSYPARYRETALAHGGWLPDDETEVEAAHNEFVQLGAELGLFGFALVAWLIAGLWRVFGPLRVRPLRLLWAVGLISAVGLIVASFSGFPLQRVTPPFIVAVILGCLSGLMRETSPPRSTVPEPTPWRRPRWVPAALLAACGAVVGLGIVTITASAHLHSARRALGAGDFVRATRSSRAALRLAPWRPDAQLVLGTALLHRGHFAQAQNAFERLAQMRPHWVSAIVNLASAQLASGNAESAFMLFRRALELAPAGQGAGAGAWMTFSSSAGIAPGQSDSQSDSQSDGHSDGQSAEPSDSAPLAPSADKPPGRECSGFSIRVVGTRLSVAGRGTLHDALTCLGREMEFDVDYSSDAPRPDVPELDFEDQESLVAIGNLLAEHRLSYGMVLTPDKTRIRSLLVFGPGDPSKPKPPTPPPARNAGRPTPGERTAPPPQPPPERAPSRKSGAFGTGMNGSRVPGAGQPVEQARPGRPQPQPLRFPGPVVPGPLGLTPSRALR